MPVLPVSPVPAQAPKSGGVLTIHPLSAPPSLSPHEESTIAVVQQASPCFNNHQVALNLTGVGVDDADAQLYENYRCGSQRNFSGYCSEEIDRLMTEQSQTLDRAKRLKLVNEIDRKLQADGARPILGWSLQYAVVWPHVKNYPQHENSIYNVSRLQDVWLDR